MALKSTGGIKLPKTKNTSGIDIILYDCPSEVSLSLPEDCEPLVAEGDLVARYSPVARDEQGFTVAASVSGEVISVASDAIVIKNDMSQNAAMPDEDKPRSASSMDFDALCEYCRRYGIRGAFSGEPLYKKLCDAYGNCQRIIINCVECDPFSGHVRALIRQHAREIVLGAKILMIGMGVKKCIFALGDSMREAQNALKYYLTSDSGMVFAQISEKYPVGNEYILLNAIYGKEFARSVSTASAGFPVFSAETVYELFESFVSGLPSIYKTFTVSGKTFASEKNVRAPIGSRVGDIIDFIGTNGKSESSFAIGGPLNGRRTDRENYLPQNANMLFSFYDRQYSPASCIRCSRCASFCPMNLVPFVFYENDGDSSYESSVRSGLYNCIECGICNYMCVSRIDLLGIIRSQKGASQAAMTASESNDGKQPSETPSADDENEHQSVCESEESVGETTDAESESKTVSPEEVIPEDTQNAQIADETIKQDEDLNVVPQEEDEISAEDAPEMCETEEEVTENGSI